MPLPAAPEAIAFERQKVLDFFRSTAVGVGETQKGYDRIIDDSGVPKGRTSGGGALGFPFPTTGIGGGPPDSADREGSKHEANPATDDVIQNALSLLSAMIESTADGILVIDQTGQISRYNQRFLKLWRIPQPLAASLDSHQLMEHVLNRLKDPGSFLEKARGICEKPETQGCETIEFKDGRIFEQDLQRQCVGDRKSVV
jgi:PAS domain-containing protein